MAIPRYGRVPIELAGHVEASWTYRCEGAGWRTELNPADQGTNLIVELGVSGAPRIYFCGPEPTHRSISTPPGTVCVGIRLQPGSVAELFGLMGEDVVGTYRLLEDVVPREHGGLVERLAERPERTLEQMLRFLGKRAIASRRPPALARMRSAVSMLTRERPSTIDDVVRELGMSPRTLRRELGAWVGLGPKRFLRVVRLREAARRVRSAPSLAVLALESGFSDQAHMTREFVSLIGVSPRALRESALPFVPGSSRSLVE